MHTQTHFSQDVLTIGSVIESVVNVAISTISVIGANTPRNDIATDSLHVK